MPGTSIGEGSGAGQMPGGSIGEGSSVGAVGSDHGRGGEVGDAVGGGESLRPSRGASKAMLAEPEPGISGCDALVE